MNSNWFLYGPFPFEASAVAGSARTALAHIVEQFQSIERWETLHYPSKQPDAPGRTDGRKPGLYLVLRTEEEVPPFHPRRTNHLTAFTQKPQLAGFWVVFSHTYLGEGVGGPPDKEPPYAQGILDACTEEVWWKNIEVYPRQEGSWKPCMLFEWPSELAYRSTLAPPGIPLSLDEIANPDAEERLGGDWLERLDDEVMREERLQAEALRSESPWLNLPQHRSLVMIIQGFLNKRRVSHEGGFRMVHPEWLSTGSVYDSIPFETWMNQLFSDDAPERTEHESHYLGQPLELPNRVGFPISGWLTRNLTVWPVLPVDIRRGALSPRDIGSKLVAQLKQASVVTALVLLFLVGLSWVVYMLTKPPVVAVIAPPPPPPEPAMSVCSADHAKFMDEFRCQIESFVYGPGTDQPVCGDSGSKELVSSTMLDLQAEYCGLKDREIDGWVWPRGASAEDTTHNFGYVAATKACFNVLGYPYNYKLPTDFSRTAKTQLPDPDLFLNHPDLSIRGLQTLITQLDSACDAYRDRMEYEVEGAVFATHVGTRQVSARKTNEAAVLREHLSAKVMRGVKSDLRRCFYAGLEDGHGAAGRLGELCRFDQDVDQLSGRSPKNDIFEQRKIWQELYGDGGVRQVQETTGEYRPLDSVVERYDFSRFGNPLLPNRPARSASLWQCHEKLTTSGDTQGRLLYVPTTWSLKVPVPNRYRIEGAGVKTQLGLDATLRAFADGGNPAAGEAGPCWKVTSRRLSKYTPVHPLLIEPDPAGWPTDEQQICGQVCATRYKVAQTLSEWVTPARDLQMCITQGNPVATVHQRHLDRVSGIDPSSGQASEQFAEARRRMILAVDSLSREPADQTESVAFRAERAALFPSGAGFDTLRIPWNSRPERSLDQVSRAYATAVQRKDETACERIALNDALFVPSGVTASGDISSICAANYSRLTTTDQNLCSRYRELLPRFEALKNECRLAVRLNLVDEVTRSQLDQYLDARILKGESWVVPTEEQICAFNLIAQNYLRDEEERFLLGGIAPPAWAGETSLGSRIAGGGYGAKESTGVVYNSTDNLSRVGRAHSLNTCSYVASQCFAEKLLEVTRMDDLKPFDWKEVWSRQVDAEIYNIDLAKSNRLREASPWCGLIQPYTNLQEGDIDYPCAKGVDDALQSVSRTIDYLAAQAGTDG